MSRRSAGSAASPGSNTLFKYFSKSPKAAGGPSTPSTPSTPSVAASRRTSQLDSETPRRKRPSPVKETNSAESDDSDSGITPTPRRKRIRVVSASSDDENTGNTGDINNTTKPNLEDSFKFEKKSKGDKFSTPESKKMKVDSPKTTDTSSTPQPSSQLGDSNNWTHCRLDWLKPENIRDAEKRRPDHPDYNPRTLFVPKEFRASQTPAHRQWWDMKAAHYDCVLFFKVGKFYELYHMDAAVGVNELGFSYMKGDFAHSGFPESAYARMASTLVQKGYRVARVEQTETPDMLQERIKNSNKAVKDKVVQREICQVTSKGTEVCGLQYNGPAEAKASYMLAIGEIDLGAGCSRYGVCFIDTSIGTFHLGQFDDDMHSSRLLTVLAHYPPVLVLRERGVTSDRTSKVLRATCHLAKIEVLRSQKEFWSASQTLKTLAEKYYLSDSGTNWPEGLKPMLSDVDALGLTPSENYTLAVRALGACVWYLTDSVLDIQIMEMSNFTKYNPPDTGVKVTQFAGNIPNNMVLDATTLFNLRIIGDDSSLISKLDHCATPMGKRLLHQWICSPSCNVNVIKERQNGITFFLDNQSLVQDIRLTLNTLPDMERLFTKIHSLGNLNLSKNHPDSRAIFYEEKTYSKRKIFDFLSILKGFRSVYNILEQLKNHDSSFIQKNVLLDSDKHQKFFERLAFFKDAFSHDLAEKEGKILPGKGVDKEYDAILQEISDIESDLETYRESQEKYFKCKVAYVGSDKKRYQLEVAESKASKAGSMYYLEGTRKGYKKFSTSETKEFLAQMIQAEQRKYNVLKDLNRRIFESFSQSHMLWQNIINCVSILDVMIGLSEYTRLQPGDMCIPEIRTTKPDEKPFVKIQEGRHPCIACSIDFIPNDTNLNTCGISSLVLLTGPNMGGKSTLMRQLGLLTIMAQIGCHIPASNCSMTIIDRIFTRLGAHDDIISGQSTFLVELSETASILKHTSIDSLVLLDELGRGTSTYDGTAIAAAVVNELSNRGCRTVFSTHYHTLVEDFKNNPNVSLYHMACMVESDESNSNDAVQETVTFLYKLSRGACPKSYGFNAARLAGIPKSIIERAHQISTDIEKKANMVSLFKRIYIASKTNPSDLKDLVIECRKLKL